MPDAKGPIKLNDMLCEELKHIRGVEITDRKLESVFEKFLAQKMTALCFSGGGIRSATFGLGIVQSLAKHGLLDEFDYLSTVSGGGYLGSWLSAWIRREQVNNFEQSINQLVDDLAQCTDAKKFSELGKKITELEKNISALKDEQKASESKHFSTRINALELRLNKLKEDRNVCADAKKLEELHDNIAAQDADLYARFGEVSPFGVKRVQDKLNAHIPARPANPDDPISPNTEPRQFQHLREYSNFMSPKVGLLSADTWTLFGIYLRNVFLNWTIFVPILVAVLLLPRIIFELTVLDEPHNYVALALFGFGSLCGVLSLYFVVSRIPSAGIDGTKPAHNTDAGVLQFAIVPLFIFGFSMITISAWFMNKVMVAGDWYQLFAPDIYLSLIPTAIPAALFLAFKSMSSPARDFLSWKTFWTALAAVFATVTGQALMLIFSQVLFDVEFFEQAFAPGPTTIQLQLFIIFALPLFIFIFLISGAIFVGLVSKVTSDDDREWLSRFGAWILIACFAWVVLNTTVLLGPDLVAYLISVAQDNRYWYEKLQPLVVTLFAVASGLLTLAGGFSGKSEVRTEPKRSRLSIFLSIAPQIAAVIFLGFILIGLTTVTEWLLEYFKSKFFVSSLSPSQDLLYLLVWTGGLAVLGIVMACLLNVNKFSLHGAYRDRLSRAYLGASHVTRKADTFTGFDDSDNFQIHRLKGQKPFHVINSALNLIGGKNLAWQNRRAASFTMTPLYCGSWPLGYRQSNEYSRNESPGRCRHLRYCNKFAESCGSIDKCELPGKAIRLGTAMAISGAAANPNMGYYSSPVVTFLMSLFNIRLGWWLGNTGHVGSQKSWFGLGRQFCTKPSPTVAVLPLINEMLGRTDVGRKYLNVSDGGHFENLALYEMVLRRCKYIVLSDAAADGEFTFSEISNAIQKCYVDLGVTIKFKNGIDIFSRATAEENKDRRKRFAIAQIIYPEKDGNKHFVGHLIYIRPAFYGSEPTDVANYANAQATFPHQTTSDQFFDEKQFEAYRALGFYTMERIFGDSQVDDLDDFMDVLLYPNKRRQE